MGIHGLTQLLSEAAPAARKEAQLKDHFGRKVAVDASMCLYQFLIAIRTGPSSAEGGGLLATDTGEVTSHLLGMFARTARLLENGLKPCYVFDGKPPELKSSELSKRKERRAEAEADLKKAHEEGDQETVFRMEKRTVTVTREQTEETKKLLRLMGVPVVEAPCEAEAQCAELCKGGRVWATASEDMDSLTFATPILLRHLLYAEARKMPIVEWSYAKVLEELQLTSDQFVDMCILLGCDYCDNIRGIGPKRALELIRRHGSLEEILAHLDRNKFKVPDPFPIDEVRRLFRTPEVTPAAQVELKWGEPDEEGLKQFLCVEKGFSEKRVLDTLARIKASRGKALQGRLDGFFAPVASPPAASKRKAEAAAGVAKKGKAAPATAKKGAGRK